MAKSKETGDVAQGPKPKGADERLREDLDKTVESIAKVQAELTKAKQMHQQAEQAIEAGKSRLIALGSQKATLERALQHMNDAAAEKAG